MIRGVEGLCRNCDTRSLNTREQRQPLDSVLPIAVRVHIVFALELDPLSASAAIHAAPHRVLLKAYTVGCARHAIGPWVGKGGLTLEDASAIWSRPGEGRGCRCGARGSRRGREVAGARLGLVLGLGVCVVGVAMQELLRFAHSGIVETRREVDVLRCGVSDECPLIPVTSLPHWALARTTKLWGIPPLRLSSINDPKEGM
jgi:hypothetical protein